MQLFNHIATIAILAGPLSVVLGAQTIEEITINIQKAQSAITNANNDAKNVNNAVVATRRYSTIVNNNNNIARLVSGYDNAIQGTTTLTDDEQTELVEATTPFYNSIATYYRTLIDRAKYFAITSQRKAVQESVDDLQDVIDEYFRDLEALGPKSKATLEAQASDDDEECEELDEAYGDEDIDL